MRFNALGHVVLVIVVCPILLGRIRLLSRFLGKAGSKRRALFAMLIFGLSFVCLDGIITVTAVSLCSSPNSSTDGSTISDVLADPAWLKADDDKDGYTNERELKAGTGVRDANSHPDEIVVDSTGTSGLHLRPIPRIWLVLLSLCVLKPIVEEVLYRGALFLLLMRIFGRWASMLLVTGAFVVSHARTYGFSLLSIEASHIALMSLSLFGILFYTRRLRWCVIWHSVFNLGVVLANALR